MADRISQAPVEVVVLPTDAKARISQGPVEAVIGNAAIVGGGNPRVSQTALEPVVRPTSELARVTQSLVEVLLHVTVVNVTIENCCITALQDAFPAVALSEVATIDAIDIGLPVAISEVGCIDALDTSVQISAYDDCNRLVFNSGVRVTQSVLEPVVLPTSSKTRVTSVVLEAITRRSFTGMFDPAIFDPAIYDH